MHLARVFRVHYGTPVGACLRGLRMTWAAGRLTESDDGIARWRGSSSWNKIGASLCCMCQVS